MLLVVKIIDIIPIHNSNIYFNNNFSNNNNNNNNFKYILTLIKINLKKNKKILIIRANKVQKIVKVMALPYNKI